MAARPSHSDSPAHSPTRTPPLKAMGGPSSIPRMAALNLGLSICVAVDRGDICRRAFEEIFVFDPKQICVVHCSLPDEKLAAPGTDANFYSDLAAKHNIYAVRYDSIDVKSATEIPDAVITYATRHHCTLIALGTKYTEQPGKHSFGRVSDMIVRTAHLPVCVVRTTNANKKSVRYAVAVDDSKVSVPCLQFLRTLARPVDEIVVFSCQATLKEAEDLVKKQTATSGLITICSSSRDGGVTPPGQTPPLGPAAPPVSTIPAGLAIVSTKAFKRKTEMSLAENLCVIAEEELSADLLVLSTGWKRKSYDLGSTSSACMYQQKLRCNVLVYKNASVLDIAESGRRTSESARDSI